MYFLIKEAKVTYPIPEKHNIFVSDDAQDLINKLLDKNRKKRIGALGGVKEILEHPFFSELDIDALLKKTLTPEYMPEITGDLQYFDQRVVQDNSVEFSVI